MMMMMIELKHASVPTAVWMVSYWVSPWNKYPPITILPNICEYRPVPTNPIPVSF